MVLQHGGYLDHDHLGLGTGKSERKEPGKRQDMIVFTPVRLCRFVCVCLSSPVVSRGQGKEEIGVRSLPRALEQSVLNRSCRVVAVEMVSRKLTQC